MTNTRDDLVPLFRLYSLADLQKLTPYSEAYLFELKQRPYRIRPHFRKTVALLLGRSEDELFGAIAQTA